MPGSAGALCSASHCPNRASSSSSDRFSLSAADSADTTRNGSRAALHKAPVPQVDATISQMWIARTRQRSDKVTLSRSKPEVQLQICNSGSVVQHIGVSQGFCNSVVQPPDPQLTEARQLPSCRIDHGLQKMAVSAKQDVMQCIAHSRQPQLATQQLHARKPCQAVLRQQRLLHH